MPNSLLNRLSTFFNAFRSRQSNRVVPFNVDSTLVCFDDSLTVEEIIISEAIKKGRYNAEKAL